MSTLISKEIGLKYSLWNLLMCNKLLIVEFLKNENLFELLIKDSNIAYELKQNKSYEIFKNKINEIQEQLDYFTELGYLLKRKESIFSITYDIVIYPYTPVISPIGFTTFTGEIYTLSDNIILTGSELSKFEKISTIICNQIDSGRHSHIRRFTYTKDQLSYSDVYEIKDNYFDAMLFSNMDGNIKLYETEPLNLPTKDGKDEKQWGFKKSYPVEIIENKQKIDEIISTISWKKNKIGLLIKNGVGYWLLSNNIAENFHDRITQEIHKLPQFFEKALFNYHTVHSRIFEDSVSTYLSNQYNVNVITRKIVKNSITNEQYEIDSYIHDNKNQKIIVGECKLRFEDKPINYDEVVRLKEKIEFLQQKNSYKVVGMIITNVDKLDSDAENFVLEKNDIEFWHASLSHNWKNRSDWKVTNLTQIC